MRIASLFAGRQKSGDMVGHNKLTEIQAEAASPDRDGDPVRIERIWAGPARLGECPIWDDRRRRLFWIDSLEKRIWSAAGDGSQVSSWALPCVIGSLALCADGRLLAGLAEGFAFIDVAGDEPRIEWLGDPEPHLDDTRLNDGKVDRQGRFWCGSMNVDFASPNASLYRLDRDLSWQRMDTGFTVSNGIAFSPNGRALYFSDSRVDKSYRYDLDPVTGDLGARRPFIDSSAYAGRIDGATVDTQGRYWAALFEGAAVGCFSPDGTLLRHIALPVSCPTMCAFGGAAMETLFISSATFSMTGEALSTEPQAGGLFAVHGLGAKGIPEPRFARK